MQQQTDPAQLTFCTDPSDILLLSSANLFLSAIPVSLCNAVLRCAIYRGHTPPLAVTCPLLLYLPLAVCSPPGAVVSSLYLVGTANTLCLQASLALHLHFITCVCFNFNKDMSACKLTSPGLCYSERLGNPKPNQAKIPSSWCNTYQLLHDAYRISDLLLFFYFACCISKHIFCNNLIHFTFSSVSEHTVYHILTRV